MMFYSIQITMRLATGFARNVENQNLLLFVNNDFCAFGVPSLGGKTAREARRKAA